MSGELYQQMAVRRKSKKPCRPLYVSYLLYALKIIPILILAYFFYRYKFMLVIVLFEFLDFLKMMARQAIPAIPVDLAFIFGVTAAYYYGLPYAMIIFVLAVINRFVMVCVEQRHLSKALRMLFIYFLVTLLTKFTFFSVAFGVLLLNYIMKYAYNIPRGNLDIYAKSYFHITNFSISTIAFYMIAMIFEYLPFLAN